MYVEILYLFPSNTLLITPALFSNALEFTFFEEIIGMPLTWVYFLYHFLSMSNFLEIETDTPVTFIADASPTISVSKQIMRITDGSFMPLSYIEITVLLMRYTRLRAENLVGRLK